jgi:hypothetical protein
MARTLSPVYQHDCDACRFMGTVADSYARGEAGWVDLYHCPRGVIGGGSLIARYGDEGREYLSSPVEYAASNTGPLGVAKALLESLRQHGGWA